MNGLDMLRQDNPGKGAEAPAQSSNIARMELSAKLASAQTLRHCTTVARAREQRSTNAAGPLRPARHLIPEQKCTLKARTWTIVRFSGIDLALEPMFDEVPTCTADWRQKHGTSSNFER